VSDDSSTSHPDEGEPRGGADRTEGNAPGSSSAPEGCDPSASVMAAPARSRARERILEVCRDIIAPLVRADQGEISLISIEPDSISVHLTGTCSGCPGAQMTTAYVIEPAIHAVAPTVRVFVTTGFHIPGGASPIDQAPDSDGATDSVDG